MHPGEEFRRLLRSEPYVFTTGLYTPLQAKIAERVGLKAVHVSGYSASLGYLGAADLGFLTMREAAEIAGMIARVVKIPVIADADDGYGNAMVAMRTVREFERRGVAGIHIEDQRGPKRCGHLVGKAVIPLDEAVLKFKAVIRAREDPSLVIIARTDVMGTRGGTLEEAIRRAVAYADAGADMLWAEFTGPDEVEAMRAFAEAVRSEYPDIPLVFNYSSSFKWSRSRHKLTFKQLAEMGYRYIFVSLGALHAETYAVWNFMEDLARNQERAQWRLEELKAGHPTENHHALGDFEYYKAIEEVYLPPELGREKYQSSKE